MKITILGLVLALGLSVLALPAWGDPCYRTYVPAAKQQAPAYVPPAPRVYAAPTQHHRGRDVVLFAEAYFPTIDYAVKDVFIFTGPPPALLPGLTLGVNAQGQEVRGLPVVAQGGGEEASPPEQDAVRPVLGMEDDGDDQSGQDEVSRAPKSKARSDAERQFVAALDAACASCHTQGGKVKGEFVLFERKGALARNLDWKVIKEVTTPDARTKSPARMPPASSGKTLPAFARLEINRRAG